MLTINDYAVLEALIDKNDKLKGIAPRNGTTRAEITIKTQLSYTTIHNALQKFESLGYITCGLKNAQAKTYILTAAGIKLIKDLKGYNGKEVNIYE